MGDPIAAAIAASEGTAPGPRATVKVTLGTGDEVLINVPVDLTIAARLGLAHYVSGPEFDAILSSAAEPRRRPSILVPAHPLARG